MKWGETHHFKETPIWHGNRDGKNAWNIELDGGNSIVFVFSPPIWRKLPNWLICFKQVGSTTTQKTVYLVCFLMMFDHFGGKTGWHQHFFVRFLLLSTPTATGLMAKSWEDRTSAGSSSYGEIVDLFEIPLSNEKRDRGCSFRMPGRACFGVPTSHSYLLFFLDCFRTYFNTCPNLA